jgi:biopolymer transport protein ExbD
MSKRKTPGLNTGAMSDISFLLLTFFLLTSSINTEQGIPRKLPPPKTEDTEDKKVDINKRNVLNVVVNFRDEILVNGDQILVNELKAKAKEFFANPSNDPSLPEKVSKPIDGIGDFPVSKGVVSLTNDQGTKDDRYESDYDTVNIGVEVTAKTLDDLHTLAQIVRDTILSYLRATDTAIMDYNFAAQQIQYDSLKPCYWQVLTYQCDVNNTYDDEQESNSDI